MVTVLETQTVAPNSIPLPLHVVLELNKHTLTLPCSAAVWLGLWNSDQVVLKSSIRSSASPRSAVVGLPFWNSDHVVLKLSIRNSDLPRWQQSHWGLRVTQDVHFWLLTHSKQLLLLRFCDTAAETEVSVRTHERTDGRTEPRNRNHGRMDRQTWKSK